jgi:hypothetical protein
VSERAPCLRVEIRHMVAATRNRWRPRVDNGLIDVGEGSEWTDVALQGVCNPLDTHLCSGEMVSKRELRARF